MFEKILISVPMEQFPEKAINRAREMEKGFGSEIILSYVIEDNVFDRIASGTKFVMTQKETHRFKNEMVKTHRKKARELVKKEAERILHEKLDGFFVKSGIYSDEVLKMIAAESPDLILMEYQPFDMLRYRILDRSPIPVWVVRKEGPVKKIGLFCTNQAPNLKAPEIAKGISKNLGSELKTYFIKDPRADIDSKEPERLSRRHGMNWNEVVEEKVDTFILKKIKKENFDLIILGRIKKRKYLPFRSTFAKRTDCSVLLVN